MPKGTILSIGFDDTDSARGMCTTFLAYKMVDELSRRGAKFLDFPRLVRLNPNIPWKTRGNGAVSLRLRTGDPAGAKSLARRMLSRYSDTGNGANPGLVFVEGPAVPPALADFGRLALWRLIRRGDAKRFAVRNGLEHSWLGNGQGLVGAIGAVGYEFGDHTLELLSYRKRSRLGKRRELSAESVRRMQSTTAPHTFGSYDERRGRPMISPRGPDPVLYGIRGESAGHLLRASQMIRAGERPDGHMIFRSNQGTGDHLRNELGADPAPYTSGTIAGTVSAAPTVLRGGHVMFPISSGGRILWCAVYKPTGMAPAVAALAAGDVVRAGGGVRRATRSFPRVLNVEFVRVARLAKITAESNPRCGACHKSMKSKGRGQGYECPRCGARGHTRMRVTVRRKIGRRLYIPDASALRHLARPPQRAGRANRARFDGSLEWFRIYQK